LKLSIKKIDTLVVSAGQAGVAISEHLSKNGVPHLVLEKDRVAERWRTGKWDSLLTDGSAWHDCFPSMAIPDAHPDDFIPKEQVADYFAAYAEQFNAPVRCGVEVTKVQRNIGRPGFHLETSTGIIEANNVVPATGAFQCPFIPPVVPEQ
jgi:putative flavoprotein involved in K+ transport